MDLPNRVHAVTGGRDDGEFRAEYVDQHPAHERAVVGDENRGGGGGGGGLAFR